MSTPQSLSPAPLTGLGDHSFAKLLSDDFSYQKFNFKVKAATKLGGAADYKAAVPFNGKAPAQEIKVKFPYKGEYFWFGARADSWKIHCDLGEINIGKKVNLFTNLKYGSGTESVRAGFVIKHANYLNHTRLEFRGFKNWYLLSRAQGKHTDFVYNFASEVSLADKEISRFDFLLGYQKKDFDLYFRHLSSDKPIYRPCSFFALGRFLGDFVYRKNENTFGGEVEYKGGDNVNLSLGASTVRNGVTAKARIDLLKDQFLNLSFKGKFNDTFGYVVSTQVPLQGQKVNGGIFPVPVGITLETVI